MTQAKELRLQSDEQLKTRHAQLRREIFLMKNQHVLRKEEKLQFNEMAKKRKEIARILTILSQRKRAA